MLNSTTNYTGEDFEPEDSMTGYNIVFAAEDDLMPSQWRHLRNGPRKVREEYKVLVHKLQSTLHMSERQVQGAIVHGVC